jgi:hypothetical protein
MRGSILIRLREPREDGRLALLLAEAALKSVGDGRLLKVSEIG